MRKFFVLLVMLSVVLPVRPAKASGIPVFDGAGLAQDIIGYVQTIMDYAEQLNQLNVMDNQYFTQLQQYQRELEEYEHFLRQVQSMGRVLSDADWQKVLQQTITYYGNSDWASIPNINVTTTQGQTNVKTVVETAYSVPDEVGDAVTFWQTKIPGYQMPAREQEEHAKNYAHMQRFLDRQMMVAKNQEQVNERSAMVNTFRDDAANLPDDSDLQTQHLIAQEIAFLLQQQEIIVTQLNQLIASQETMSEFAATQDSEAKYKNLENVERHKNNYLPSSLGTESWKNF